MLTNEGTNRTFLQVYKGQIVQRVGKDTEGARHRITKFGKDVYELYFDTLTGYLDDVRLDDAPKENPQIGKQWVFVLEDGNDIYELKIGYKSIAAYGLLTRLVNLDFSKPLKIKTYWITGKDSVDRGYAVFHQEGEKIEPFFTREDPKGLPELKKVVINDEEQWDHSARLKYLKRVVDEKVLPVLREERLIPEPAESSEPDKPKDDFLDEAPPPSKEDDLQPDDNLPF